MSEPNTNDVPEPVSASMGYDTGTLGKRKTHRPVHVHPAYVSLVVAGGMLGTLARYGLEEALPAPSGWPLPTLLINVAGALALGALLEGLVRRGPDTGRRRILRLLAGTGFLGAFTTYSSLALEANLLLHESRIPEALLYMGASLVGGACATAAGIWGAARHHRAVAARTRRISLHPPQDGKRP